MTDTQAEIDALLGDMTALVEEATGGSAELSDTPSAAGAVVQAPRISGQRSASGPIASPADPRRQEDVRRILTLEVPVIVQLAERQMLMSKILNLSNGAILEFDKPFDAPLELMINNKCVGIGQAVKVGENFGLRVTTMGSLKSRIQALSANDE